MTTQDRRTLASQYDLDAWNRLCADLQFRTVLHDPETTLNEARLMAELVTVRHALMHCPKEDSACRS